MQQKLPYLLLMVLLATIASAQSSLSIRGSVRDRTGATVAGAEVRLEDAAHIALASAVSDDKGAFLLSGIRPGAYQLTVPAYVGFAARTLPLSLTTSIQDLKIALQPESVSAEITVTSQSPALSTDSSDNHDTVSVSAQEIRRIPVFDQDIVATMTPFLDAGSGSSGGVTIIVDGVEVKAANVSASAIQEVKINNDPYASEYSRPGRGRIEIISKPGSPQFHGEANFTFRDAIFNAKNYFAQVRPPESRRIYEGHVSGPVGHGRRTSFIASGSRQEQDTAVVVNALGPNGAINENVLTPNRRSEYSIRVNHDFSPVHRFSFGYTFQQRTRTNAGVGGIVLPEAGYHTSGREDDLILNDRLILTPNLINQLAIMIEKDEDVTNSVTNAQSIMVSGAFTGGGAQADIARTENTIHVNEILTWSHGRHYLRAGVQLPQFSRRANDDRTNRLGTFQFASLATYAANTPYVFTAQQGVGRGVYWINEFGSFIQDQIKITPKLQATIGVRYDWQTFVPDNNNLGPRISVAYAPGRGAKAGKTVLRAGAGIFYDRTGGDFPATIVLHDGVLLRSVQLQNPTSPIPPGTSFASVPTNLVRNASNLRAPYSIQYSFGMERQILKSVTVTAAYRGQVQIKSFRSRDANAPILPPDPSLNAIYPRPNLALGQIQQIESGGRGLSNAFDLSFRGQAGRWFAGQMQYTLSRAYSNTGGIQSFSQDQYRPNHEWGRTNQDRLHQFLVLGTIYPDHWASLGVGVTLLSGPPYTETTGSDDYHTGLGNARPIGVGRNTLQAGGTASLDLLWSHDFHLSKTKGEGEKVFSAGLSGFNVLNHTNYTSYIGTLSSSRFGRPTAGLPGRQLQLSLGYRF